MRPANERRRYIVTSVIIGWGHAQNGPCIACALKTPQCCTKPFPQSSQCIPSLVSSGQTTYVATRTNIYLLCWYVSLTYSNFNKKKAIVDMIKKFQCKSFLILKTITLPLLPYQSGAKTNLVAKFLATNFAVLFVICAVFSKSCSMWV